MVKCLFCGILINNPKEHNGEIIQKFCSDQCRYDYHNRLKREKLVFAKEAMSSLKKILQIGGTR